MEVWIDRVLTAGAANGAEPVGGGKTATSLPANVNRSFHLLSTRLYITSHPTA